MSRPRSVVVVGASTAGLAAARELRRRGHTDAITVIGGGEEPCSRPPLSKQVLKDGSADGTVSIPTADLGLEVVRSPAAHLDPERRRVTTRDGHDVPYDALVVATGSAARRIAAPGQSGELVLRTLDDARTLRTRLGRADTAVVVGAGFLGMEVASACVHHGVSVTVVDVAPPLERVVGTFVSAVLVRRARSVGVELVQSEGPVSLDGDPVTGVRLGEGTVLRADLVVTCAGDVPVTDWLDGHAWAGPQGVEIDHGGRTPLEGVLAAGDVAAVREEAWLRRRPFWSNAVAQGRLAAATLLGDEPGGPVWDDYFWSEVCGHSLKMVGPVPRGEPEVLAGDPCTGSALLRWWDSDVATVVAVDHRIPVPRLRALALERERA
ncbi:hypothetical protein ASD11_10105 [Aeromicrobium sp. Root495]|uniref:NAD(P)/FAD-dependent oxidoreductase n=1 Tax=Aeromicrobium sp. Root495 TaxID=1736550 RepID=UPI0006F653B6|nr:NAD(P)/FAD-dependent oxidoreductase [Aeromicrobium sp. Root495]KQY59863.1 hypothetical protein ASD11_10105 [Aeromicrobium sp. Root495]